MLDLILAAEDTAQHAEAAINPWVVGGSALGFLLILLFITMMFGLGREHS